LTLGDVAGIGPELIAQTVSDSGLSSRCRLLVVGHPSVLERALKLKGIDRSIEVIESPARICLEAETICCWNPGSNDAAEVPPGQVDPRAGRAAYDYLVGAADAALSEQVDAIVTAPLNKAALHAAGLKYPGHTEILAERCGVTEFAMMLHLPPGEGVSGEYGLSVAHVTLHTSIRSVPDLLNERGIREKIRLMDAFLKRIGCSAPQIGVCALNPHGGEGGLFGDEEQAVIAPAVSAERAQGLEVDGPIPADALLRRAAGGEFDGVIAMYHDQGHIALKLLGFDRAVNITLGLPIIRTSPSHGTAYDIAWQGKADSTGFRSAIETALNLIPSS
ncbi:MAG TPA: 4-hydroxythreonine-4-phosphate dehydrogenase PdxA, partial [Planctomycetaceae bacterium]|nr:4-hydroxythreonine-4-phosphate dehydrogenase PdxA [Planctomycetaceae bacterium]